MNATLLTTPPAGGFDVDHDFLRRLRQLAARVRGADPSLHNLAYFRTPTDVELEELRTSALALLQVAMHSSQELADDILPSLEQTPLEDLASVIDGELRRDRRQVEERDVDDSSTWQVGITAVQILSKVLKAAAAIENTYCQELGLDSEISHVAETTTAIEIRQAYRKFWTTVDLEAPRSQADLEKNLRTASTAIARLTGRSIFLDMRALDRRILLSLQRRILGWLTGGADAAEGRSTWQDLEAFAELIRLINHRQELVEHDLALVPELMSTLGENDPLTTPLGEDSLCQRLRRLLGRDAELDALLARPETTTTSELLDCLGRLEADILSDLPLPEGV